MRKPILCSIFDLFTKKKTNKKNLGIPKLENLEHRLTPAAPNVLSINRISSSPVSNQADFGVIFDQPVTGVVASDFQIVKTGTVTSNATLQITGSGASYTVQISGITGNGTIGLNLLDNGSIINATSEKLEVAITNLTFSNPLTFAQGSHPVDLVTGDFNLDGKLDIATLNFGGTSEILLGNGNGTFQLKQTLSVPSNLKTIQKGDFNRDGKPDILVTGPTGGEIFQGNGDGTFSKTSSGFASDSIPLVEDLNNDSILDITTSYTISIGNIIIGRGLTSSYGKNDGTFNVSSGISTDNLSPPAKFVSGDYDNDGTKTLTFIDLPNKICVNGGFGSPSYITAGTTLTDLVTTDFNKDGKIDIAAVDQGSNSFIVLLGNGNSTFKSPTTFPIGSNAQRINYGDFNADGIPDISTLDSNPTGNSGVKIFLGNGDGTFQSGTAISGLSSFPNTITIVDVNGDALPDVLTTDANTFQIILNESPVSRVIEFGPQEVLASTQTTGVTANNGTLGDLNQDGSQDLVVFSSTGGVVSLLGNGNGTFKSPSIIYSYSSALNGFNYNRNMKLADINHDGKLDLLFDYKNNNQSGVAVFLGNGNGTFQTDTGLKITNTQDFLLEDFNRDGKLDLAVNINNNSINIFLGNGNGTFKSANPIPLSVNGSFNSLDLADFNLDGILDIATGELNPTIYLGNGNGTFQSPLTIPAPFSPGNLEAVDINGDGKPDLIISADSTSYPLYKILGNGDGTFSNPVSFGPPNVAFFKTADLNADNKLDIYLNTYTPTSQFTGFFEPAFILAENDYSFGSPTDLGNVYNPDTFVDIDGDNRPEIFSFYGNVHYQKNILIENFTGQTYTGQNNTPTHTPTPTPRLVTGSKPPSTNHLNVPGTSVNLFNPVNGEINGLAVPFPGFQGEVRVTSADINQDGIPEIIAAAGSGGGPAIKILDSQNGSVLRSFFAFNPAFSGGIFITVKDLNNDNIPEIIAGAGKGGGPHVRVFDGNTLNELYSFFAYDPSFNGGVSVATADINNDSIPEIITGAGPGGGPHVKVFDVSNGRLINEWFAYDINFTGGVYVAAGDIGNTGSFKVVTGAGIGGGPLVSIWNPLNGNLLNQFFAYETTFSGGVRVAVNDANNDNTLDLVTGAGLGGGPLVKVFDYPGLNLLFQFFSGRESDKTGVFVG